MFIENITHNKTPPCRGFCLLTTKGPTMRKSFTYEGQRYFVRADSEPELYEKMARKKIELEEQKVKESNVNFSEYAKEWYEVFKRPYIGDNTNTMYKNTLRILNDYIGVRRVKDVTSTDLQRIITAEYEKGRSKSHIDKLYLTMKQIFKQATIDRKIQFDPSLSLRKPQMEESTGRALTPAERKAILTVAETHRYGLWIKFMLYLGIRPSETSIVTYEDIDMESGFVHVRGTKSRKANRFVPIPEPLSAVLSELQGTGYIFTTKAGNKLNRDKIRRRWRAFKRDLDIHMGAVVYRNEIVESVLADDLVLYCLRHTYGTDAQMAGVPIDILADLMGHEKIEVTRKYYIDDNKQSKNRAREIFNQFYTKHDA